MEPQTLLNASFGMVGLMFGYIINGMRQTMVSLQRADSELADKVQKIEVIVAGEYVKKDDMDSALKPISQALIRIETKLDRKVDKE